MYSHCRLKQNSHYPSYCIITEGIHIPWNIQMVVTLLPYSTWQFTQILQDYFSGTGAVKWPTSGHFDACVLSGNLAVHRCHLHWLTDKMHNIHPSFRVTSLALGQSCDCPSASKATQKYMDKCIASFQIQFLQQQQNKAQLEQPPPPSWLLILLIHIGSQVKRRTSQS